MDKKRLQKYAELIVKKGINLQKDQTVRLMCNLDQIDFITMVVEECYKAGAKRVEVKWGHQPIQKLHLNYCSLETLSTVTDVDKARMQEWVDTVPCRLWIDSDDPDGLVGTDHEKISKARMARFPIEKPYLDKLENKDQWCIAAVPGKAWAKKVFPDLSEDEACEKLWEKILDASRVYDDPLKEWDNHNAELKRHCKILNDYNFEYLEYKSANGTDFKVGLNPIGKFNGGSEAALGTKYVFNPNIPSEEVFTSPLKGVAEGKVVATKPLSYQGKIIDKFSITFKGGKAVEVHAEQNEELLKTMISMDEGAAYLGECALIGYDSPINNTGILFYNTLFDENASCHLALGRGFNDCIKGYENMTVEECRKAGVNDSIIHVDFMIGSKDMSIVGICKDGKRVQIFKDGDWVI